MKKIRNFKQVIFVFVLLAIISIELNYLYELNFAEESSEKSVSTDEFSYSMELVDKIFEEMKFFPVMPEETKPEVPVSYSDSFGEERTYGGERSHEGCDLMANENVRGKYKICSVSSGVVENIGWLEQGGWRIGIRSQNDVYYYYAHLDSYEKALEVGETVEAGQLLGRMGDSGYGKEPGTKGKFDVHLHFGIYVKDMEGKERAVNPYRFLKQLEN